VKDRLKIIYVSSEVVPLAKTGGLADVAGALPPAMADLGHDVTVILPAYKEIDRDRYPLLPDSIDLKIPIGDAEMSAGVLRSNAMPGVTVRLIDQLYFFDRKGIYDAGGIEYADNAERFAFFSRAVIELLRQDENPPDIIHCNDWQTALIPVFLKSVYSRDPFFKDTRVVFTVHNVAYQGTFPAKIIPKVFLPDELFVTEGGLEFYGKVSFLKGGIVFSDLITTVSPTYSKEIQTEEYGFGMEGILRNRSSDLKGVLNGIDVVEWNPSMDTNLPEGIQTGSRVEKERVKKALLKECGLAYMEGTPVIGIVSRLAGQKGFDLIEEAADKMMKKEIRLVVLGIGEERYENFLESLREDFPGKVFVNFAFDNTLAHMIYGGSDIFLMPSHYEPCGLGQMIAMRYGTVPIARNTGGLADTIHDENGRRNGFLFQEYEAVSFLKAFNRALKTFQRSEEWLEIMRAGMEGDYSWKSSAGRYVELYQELLASKSTLEVTP
jgi:starch synthase